MTRLTRKLWLDEAGAVVTAEMVLVGTVAVLGLVVGLNAVQSALVFELTDLSQAFCALNQSYFLSGFRGCKSWSSGSACFSARGRARVCGYAFDDGGYYDAPDLSIGVGQREVVYYHEAAPRAMVCPPEDGICPPAGETCPPGAPPVPGASPTRPQDVPNQPEPRAPAATLPHAHREYAPISPPASAFFKLRPDDVN